MDAVMFIEVLGRGGRVDARTRVSRLPAVIGRAYSSDVILDDRYVDAAHARISRAEDGTLTVEDLGSRNGLFPGGDGPRTERLSLRAGAVFRVGRTRLRLAAVDQPVPPALPDDASSSVWRRLAERRGAAVVATLIGAPALSGAFALSDASPSTAAQMTGMIVGVLALVTVWAGGWALATRLASGQSRFRAHLVLTWAVFGFATLIGAADGYAQFVFVGRGIADVIGVATGVGVAAVILYAHLSIASSMLPPRRLTIALAVAGGLFLLSLGLAETATRNRRSIRIDVALKPVPASLLPTVTPDVFLDRLVALQEKVDDEAEETAAKE